MRKEHNWPNVPGTPKKWGGAPPEGHTRRCQGQRPKGTGKQCGKWALRTKRYCEMCGGRNGKKKPDSRIMRWYSIHAGKELRKRLLDMRSVHPDERLSLTEEVDLMRIHSLMALKVYEKACLEERNKPVEIETQLKAGELLKSALNDVAAIVEKAMNVRAKSESVVGLEDLDYIVDQVEQIIKHRIEDELPEKQSTRLIKFIAKDLSSMKLPERAAAAGADPTQLAERIIDAAASMELKRPESK